jgi:hypothetical protein
MNLRERNPQFRASTRKPRLDCADVDVESASDLLV